MSNFKLNTDGTVLGTLTVSNGSIVGFPKGTLYGCKMGWARFDQLIQDVFLLDMEVVTTHTKI